MTATLLTRQKPSEGIREKCHLFWSDFKKKDFMYFGII